MTASRATARPGHPARGRHARHRQQADRSTLRGAASPPCHSNRTSPASREPEGFRDVALQIRPPGSSWSWRPRRRSGLHSDGVRPGLGQEPAPAAGCRPRDHEVLRSLPFDRITLVDGTVLIVDPVSPRPLAAARSAKAKKQRRPASRAARPRFPSKGTSACPASPRSSRQPDKEKGEEEAEDEPRTLDQDPPAPEGRGPRLHGEAEQHPDDRVLRGHAPRRGRPADPGAGFRPGLRVPAAGQGPQPGLAGPRRPRQPAALRRGEHGSDRGRPRARAAAAPRAARAEARLPGPARSTCLGLRRMDRPGAGAAASSPRDGGSSTSWKRWPPNTRWCATCATGSSPGEAAGQGGRIVERPGPAGRPGRALRIWPTLKGAEGLYQQGVRGVPTLDVGVADVPHPSGPGCARPRMPA